ncbi:interferon-induced protein 44-like, partial [Mercenaria mercenaria]|uniref:interferon-induced protein 44-like n=1 Tax=Mercenaria mercenaria TaxID=6596 RepID=UPI00234F1787
MTAFRVQFGIGLEWSPWRVPVENFKWTKETADHLREKIVKVLPTKKSGITQLRVLVIGPKGHGKSSLINSFASISEEAKLTACNAAEKESNVTTIYRSYEFLGDMAQFRVCDISGLPKKKDEEMRPFLKDIELLIKGKIKDPYEFTEETISEENEHFVADPSLSEMIHCAIFVFDCVEVYEIHQYYKDSVMTLLDAINKQ